MAKNLACLSVLQLHPILPRISRRFLSLSTPVSKFCPKSPQVLQLHNFCSTGILGIRPPTCQRTQTSHSYEKRRGNTDVDDGGIPADEIKIIAKFKSRHNYIRVLEVSRKTDHPLAGSRLLLLDGPGNIHSISFLFKTLTQSYFDVLATLPPIVPPGPIGVLGFGAGSVARLILELYPEINVQGWELDPSVIEVGRKFFGLSKIEKQYPDRLSINIGNALSATIKTGFSGILIDLFIKGSVIPELQDPNTWESLKNRLRKNGRIMVNVGGSCVEAENSERNGKVVMEDTLKAMSQVFGDDLFVLSVGNQGDDSFIALTGNLPDLDVWKKKLPMPELRSYADMWKPYRDVNSAMT